jgi:hypothetical protein
MPDAWVICLSAAGHRREEVRMSRMQNKQQSGGMWQELVSFMT